MSVTSTGVSDDRSWHVEVWSSSHDIIGEACQDTIDLLLREGQGDEPLRKPST